MRTPCLKQCHNGVSRYTCANGFWKYVCDRQNNVINIKLESTTDEEDSALKQQDCNYRNGQKEDTETYA